MRQWLRISSTQSGKPSKRRERPLDDETAAIAYTTYMPAWASVKVKREKEREGERGEGESGREEHRDKMESANKVVAL
jgi:hypothetical protein